MAKIDDFKSFVKNNPRLINHVKSGSMTWQKFYEMYDLYGESNDVWKDYIAAGTTAAAAAASSSGFLDFFKNIDLDGVQNGVNSIQRVIGALQEISGKDTKEVAKDYKPRPVYKSFDD